MLDPVRRILAAALLAVALIGLMPLIPLAYGYLSATVTNSTAGTYYPRTTTDAPFITCRQDPKPNSIRRNQSVATGNYFRCTNNWHKAVTIAWSTGTGGTGTGITVSGSTVSIPAGSQDICVRAGLAATSSSAAGTVRVIGTINQADLYAVIQLDANFTLGNGGGSVPTACTLP